ncbi:zinc ABC transporter substrate-binding protein [Paenarthrobacter sp. NPDC089322]|uniref:metal ABC transporter solute-binding protein, Zn/Mn family n=1 Tax=Paenarthrobacter sp. NPDC089322 TaxID=3155065 RepID=UPI00342E3B14
MILILSRSEVSVRRPAARLSLAASAGLAALLLSSCSGSAGAGNGNSTTASSSTAIEVVTSTNVYGDVVKAIGGDKVNVSAIITKTSQDPHSYEASAQDKLVISKAKLVVENGGGYDEFLHKIADETKVGHDNMISAVEVSGLAPEEESHSEESHSEEGHTHNHGEFNEHVWYSLETMTKLADAVASKLGSLDAASASTFTANADAFKAKLGELTGKLDAVKAANEHAPVAITEPVPLYLLEAAGLENKTPEAYSAAIEEGTDVPASVLKETTDLVSAKTVRLLAYNEQTEGPQTESVKKAAETAGVPVVNFTETLPDGKDYVQWMTENVESISAALAK